MTQLHSQEKEQFKKLFAQERLEGYEDRLRVLEAFLATDRHVTPEELTEALAASGHALEADFVRDTLKLLVRLGFASPNRFDNGVVRYEHLHLGHHHDHLVCTKCRKIVEFMDDRLEAQQVRVAAAHGFHLLHHKMELYGICADCLRERARRMPLSAAKAGETLVIREIGGGAGTRVRLMAMGLRPGDLLEVITNNGQGQIAISCDMKRFVLGRGLAQKIVVEAAEAR